MFAKLDRMVIEKNNLEDDIHELLSQQDLIETKDNEIVRQMEQQAATMQMKNDNQIRALLQGCMKAIEEINVRAHENDMSAFTNSAYFMMLSEELQDSLAKLIPTHESYLQDKNANADTFLRSILLSGHLSSLVYERAMEACNLMTNINSGESKYQTLFLILFKKSLYFFDKFHSNFDFACFSIFYMVTFI
jgi:hypothetical protein